jgi:hypothetical protein
MTLAEIIKWLESRSRREGKCLIWMRSLRGGVPQGSMIDEETGEKVTANVRRVVWAAKHGKAPHKSYVIVCNCETEGCVEPSHLKEISRSQLHKGRTFTAAHKLAVTIAARKRRTTKLSEEDVREIRYSDEPADQIAARFGVTKNHVWGIRRNEWCRDVASNPFAGLFAANDSARRKA